MSFAAPQAPQPPAKKSKKKGCLGCLGFVVVAIIVIAIVAAATGSKTSSSTASNGSSSAGTTTTAGGQSGTTAAAPPATAPATSAKPASNTVTYIVTGTPGADVTYGTAGNNSQGHSPMHITQPLTGTPSYISISAQLQGSGSLGCKIEVNGKVISQGTANGGYNIADCEIVQDPITGNWTDTNSG